MNYEFAKQLKDAGFPNSNRWIDNGTGFFVDDGELVYEVPTLSELIKACGDEFLDLRKGNSWFASGEQLFDVIGDTPEEAVKNLWLALNTPQSNESIESK